MILDEPMEMTLSRKVAFTHGGDPKCVADTLVFLHPGPQMARDSFKMTRHFTKISREGSKILADTMGVEKMQENATVQAGSKVEAIHETYSDDKSEETRDEKIAKIEESITGFSQILTLCDGVDLYQMTVDFGKMMCDNKRCKVQGKDSNGGDVSEPLSIGIWENHVSHKDRLAATIRYCCFFGLTSSLLD